MTVTEQCPALMALFQKCNSKCNVPWTFSLHNSVSKYGNWRSHNGGVRVSCIVLGLVCTTGSLDETKRRQYHFKLLEWSCWIFPSKHFKKIILFNVVCIPKHELLTKLPIFDYGCKSIIWGDCGQRNSQHLEHLQNQAMHSILSAHLSKTGTIFQKR